MPDFRISAFASILCLLALSNYALGESQKEYAENANESWQHQSELTERSYARLLSEAESEANKQSAKQLKQAKENWEEFRNLFCKSVSSTYGGQWASVHESECRVKLASQLQITTDSYGW